MNLKLLTLLALGATIPTAVLAQEGEHLIPEVSKLNRVDKDTTDLYRKSEREYKNYDGEKFKYNTFTSGSADVHKFNNKRRVFRDWGISVGGGLSFLTRGDLTSYYDRKITPGYNFYVSLDKQLTHVFGLSLAYQFGETRQRGNLSVINSDITYPGQSKPYYKTEYADLRGVAKGTTKFQQIAFLGDLNVTGLFRRMDNFSTYRWALHTYAGIGIQGFKLHREDHYPVSRYSVFDFEQELGIASFFYQVGTGLKFNLNRWVDLEARVMYVISGDDEFDAGGSTMEELPGYNLIKKNDSDNMLNVNLGVSFKLGRKENKTHLRWYDPLKEIYLRADAIRKPRTTVCENGDNDNDGVCDDWDRQLDTPSGARVDGAGVALDMDLDGVIDLHDKCVTVPGPVENDGCPENRVEQAVLDGLNRSFEGVVFDLDKYEINSSNSTSTAKLDEIASVIRSLNPMPVFYVIGATDTRATEKYNQILSQRRANSVVDYLVNKGVPKRNLIPQGRGEKDLKYPECDPASKCPEWKNEANRRVYIEQK